MENTIVQEKQNTVEGGTSQYRRGKTKYYAKVQDDIYDVFAKKDVRLTYRMIYMALSGCMIPNSEFAHVNYPKLREKSGAGSDSTITAALKELSEKGFISKMGESTYRLWHCVYKGVRENEKDYSEVKESTTPSVVTPTTPSVVPHVRVNLFQKTKERQHENDDVDFKNLVFGEDSRFRNEIQKKEWIVWLKKYGFENCQTLIKDLEWSYRNKPQEVRNPGALVNKGLTEDWQIQKRRLEASKKSELEWEAKKERERKDDLASQNERNAMDAQHVKDDTDYDEAKNEPKIVCSAREAMPECLDEGHETFQPILRHHILRIYREKINGF